MAASTAFPGTYPPITINGRRYMDGSLRSATNAAIAPGARTLAMIDPRPRGPTRVAPPGAGGRRSAPSGDH
ncbi:patatin-like phospholipase family protein [Streptomyces sp. NPDC046161]|uniref:patatin-like phospholipase family protein n=1 Tax=Streptomyces sp. NPDC046161 TaxID=3155132 RepID=UPI0034066E28